MTHIIIPNQIFIFVYKQIYISSCSYLGHHAGIILFIVSSMHTDFYLLSDEVTRTGSRCGKCIGFIYLGPGPRPIGPLHLGPARAHLGPFIWARSVPGPSIWARPGAIWVHSKGFICVRAHWARAHLHSLI